MLEYLGGAKTFIDCVVILRTNLSFAIGRQKQDFDNLITPLFETLPPLIDDYLAMMNIAREDISRSRSINDLRFLAAPLLTHREKMLSLRTRAREEAAALLESLPDHEATSFLQEAVSIFDAPFDEVPAIRKMSGMLTTARLFDIIDTEPNGPLGLNEAKDDLQKNITYIRDNLEVRWSRLSRHYFRLKARHNVKSGTN